MSLSEEKQQQLDQLLGEHSFTHARSYLQAQTRSGVRFTKAGEADYGRVCSSRIGGGPDLPENWAWPLTKDDVPVPMTFLAQLNLAELQGVDATGHLPAKGMLYFFVGVDEPAYNIEHRVLYAKEEELPTARRRSTPEETALEEEFNGYQLAARPSLEAPNYAYVDYDVIEDEEHEYEDYEDLLLSMNMRYDDVAVMFGYPMGQHDDDFHEAALTILTGKNYEYSKDKALKAIAGHFDGDETRAQQEIDDTLMLLEIETDSEIGFCWWDAGVLHFFIRKEDLLAGNFDRTYCALYSS
ncbi:YwqG family protein [Paenibacillus massiliensis]|uniref:YwqG family protein n=1 Tax=Paenibacillus massiliensis TaxID=225917 RepID=UPI00047203E1|nr:YwqG family protein [Paenibacillus massiliensis]